MYMMYNMMIINEFYFLVSLETFTIFTNHLPKYTAGQVNTYNNT